MQIGQRIINSYDNNLQENARTEHSKTPEMSDLSKSSLDLSGLKEGAVFRGEVLDIAGEKITIALENKAQLMARLQADVELGVGDRLLFSVKENNASQILIKPMFDSLYSAQTQVLEKALDAAGLSPTEKNFSAAKELMEAGMPVDKGNLVKLLSQSMKFEGTSMQTLTALNKMNIPVTEANIAQYERYQGMQHQLMGDIQQSVDGMTSFTNAFPAGSGSNTLLSVARELLDIFMMESEMTDSKDGSFLTENAVSDSTLGEQELTNAEQENVKINSRLTDEPELVNRDGERTAKEGKPGTDLQNVSNMDSDIKEADSNIASKTEQLGLTKERLSNMSSLLEKAGVSNEQTRNMINNSNTPEQLLRNMLQALMNGGASETAVRNMLDSNEFKDLFADVIKKNWSMNPKDMKNPKEIDELYDKILKQSRAFEDTIATKGGDTKDFQQNFQNMRQNMQFMEQLNNQMIYAQMPLKLSNQNANSELYVYADKRKLMEKKDGISVMLHLDMDNLGTTDVKVTLTGTNVNARFYLNDQESVDIVAENMNQLAKQLADRGFSLTNEVVKRQPQESINKVVDEIIDENAEKSIKRYTFDART